MTGKQARMGVVAFGVLAGVSPISFSTSTGVSIAKACADGTCCPEAGSDCFINGILTENAYKAAKPGPCSGQNDS
ncbi:MAG TPA: hypothetical protein VF006_32080 [Longimicrobium sp.]